MAPASPSPTSDFAKLSLASPQVSFVSSTPAPAPAPAISVIEPLTTKSPPPHTTFASEEAEHRQEHGDVNMDSVVQSGQTMDNEMEVDGDGDETQKPESPQPLAGVTPLRRKESDGVAESAKEEVKGQENQQPPPSKDIARLDETPATPRSTTPPPAHILTPGTPTPQESPSRHQPELTILESPESPNVAHSPVSTTDASRPSPHTPATATHVPSVQEHERIDDGRGDGGKDVEMDEGMVDEGHIEGLGSLRALCPLHCRFRRGKGQGRGRGPRHQQINYSRPGGPLRFILHLPLPPNVNPHLHRPHIHLANELPMVHGIEPPLLHENVILLHHLHREHLQLRRLRK